MEILEQLIEQLTQEVAQIEIKGRELTPDEIARVQAIQKCIPLLRQAITVLRAESAANLITYKIVSDDDGKLKRCARIACNFWNRFIIPKSSIVIRLGIFTSAGTTIARAYKPYKREGVVYGVVEFNTKYLSEFKDNDISGTIIHEIGHTLGFGWDEWMDLFDSETGLFTSNAIAKLGALQDMLVETEHGPGTRYSHWDEERFGKELMTGFKDMGEHVLPVTIRVMDLLDHRINEKLSEKTDLKTLMDALAQVVFSRQVEAKALDLDRFEETEIWENIPHDEKLT